MCWVTLIGLHGYEKHGHKRLWSVIFRVENEIAKAHTNSEDLVLLEVGTSDLSEPLKLIWGPLLMQTARE